MHIEELIRISSSQLEGADGPDRRGKIHQDKEVRRAVSQGASDEGKILALNSVLVLLFQNFDTNIKSGELETERKLQVPRRPVEQFTWAPPIRAARNTVASAAALKRAMPWPDLLPFPIE